MAQAKDWENPFEFFINHKDKIFTTALISAGIVGYLYLEMSFLNPIQAAVPNRPNIPVGSGAQHTGELLVIHVPNPYLGQEGYTPSSKGNAITTNSGSETITKITPKIEKVSIPRETTYYSRELIKSNITNAKIDLAFGFRNNITAVPDFRVDMFKGLDQRVYATEIVNVDGEYYKFIARAIGMGVGGQYLETGKEMNSFLLINTPKGINTSALLFKFNTIPEVKALIIKHGIKIQFDQDGKVISHLNPTEILEADVNDFYQPK